ncbi:MAG: efflux RND transporter periplasmic adaptor subunit [Myxococcales bacterium]|nr:efflux RND transporter periplasmic adaptor subunit [Myxococcales bacterium]
MERLSIGRVIVNWALLLVSCAFFLGAIWYLQRKPDTGKKRGPARVFRFNVRTAPIERGTLVHTIVVAGDVKARRTTTRTEIDGTVAELHFRDGAEVVKGALLVKLADRDQRLNVERLRAIYSQAVAALKRAQTNLLTAADEYRRLSKLKVGRTVTESDLVRARYQKMAAENTVSEMKAALRLRHVELRIAEKDLALTEIRAPSSGRISGLSVEINDLLTKNQKVLEIVSTRVLDVELYVSVSHIPSIRPRMEVSLRPTTPPGAPFIRSRITRIHAGLDQTTRNQRLVVTLDGWPNHLVPEIPVEARLSLATHRNVLLVQQDALTRLGADWVVFVVRGGKAIRVPVTIVARDQQRVEVTGKLTAGERVVVVGNEALFPFAPVLDVDRKPPARPGSARRPATGTLPERARR